jgi:hypothetical protein
METYSNGLVSDDILLGFKRSFVDDDLDNVFPVWIERAKCRQTERFGHGPHIDSKYIPLGKVSEIYRCALMLKTR